MKKIEGRAYFTISVPEEWFMTLYEAANAAGASNVESWMTGAVGEALGQYEASKHGAEWIGFKHGDSDD